MRSIAGFTDIPRQSSRWQRILLEHLQDVDASPRSDIIHAGQQGHSAPLQQVKSELQRPRMTVQSSATPSTPPRTHLQPASGKNSSGWNPASKAVAP
ncbi:MAG: hypothetical protein R3C11_16155 [Planctomycetaceae bacterium]